MTNTTKLIFLLLLYFQGCESSSFEKKNLLKSDYSRITFAGSSITWGGGFLGELSYLGIVENYLRDNKAITIIPNTLNSDNTAIRNLLSYKGTLYRYHGVNTEINGSIYGDKISIAFAKERGNQGAAHIELYIDGMLHDTFSTTNREPYLENISQSFIGDGKSYAFDLGYLYTFNHSLTINGQKNSISRSPSDTTSNAMILRKINDEGKIHHFLTFKNPPSKANDIYLTFSAGETIYPVKSSLSNLSGEINSSIEYQYGDDTNSLTTIRTYKSLDFRQTDERAIKTWEFNNSKTRNFSFKIKELSSEATGEIPEFFLNFITNHMFYFQNAGISGATATNLLNDKNTLRTTTQINDFKPGIVLLESCTNDDRHLDLNGATTTLGQYWMAYEGSALNSMFNYISFTKISEYSIKLNSNATYGDIKRGDVLIIGKGKDNRALTVRIIKSWNANNKTATFSKPLQSNDYTGSFCQIKRLDYWTENVKKVFQEIDNHPIMMIATSGVPNIYQRRLEGYREKGQELANELNAHFVDFYQATYDWKYANPPHDTNDTWSRDDTHPNVRGNELLGNAVIKVLNQAVEKF